MNKKYLKNILIFIFLVHGFCNACECDEFLGTLGGTQVYLESYKKDRKATYSRSIKNFGPLVDIRADVAKAGTRGFKTIGEEYSFTPRHLRDGRPFGVAPTAMQGGGFFLTLKELENQDAYLFSFQYALNIIGKQLEQISGIPMQALQAQSLAYGIIYLINRYFDCIKMPEDGDLVIYPNAADSHHTGIYRKSKPNWNSPYGGTIESKWGSSSPFIFQHDVFFTPDYYGDIVQFYRLKKQPDSITTLKEELLASYSTHTIRDNGYFEFNKTEENIRIRKEIEQASGQNLIKKIPQIRLVAHINFMGVCYDYAFGVIFRTYYSPRFMPRLPGNDWIEKYFSVTTEPQKGDLVCYYKDSLVLPVHYGVYDSLHVVESKWGAQPVYKHPPFYVENLYGNFIRYYRLKSEVKLENLLRME